MPVYRINVALRFRGQQRAQTFDAWTFEAADRDAAIAQAQAWRGPSNAIIERMMLTEPGRPGVTAIRQSAEGIAEPITE